MADRNKIDFQFLTENCADVLCSVRADHVIRYVSPSALDILGREPGEMIGKNFSEFVFSDDISVLDDIGAAEDGAAYSHARVRLLKKDQTPVWISINARCVRDLATGEPCVYP